MFAKADIANPGTMVVSPTDANALQSTKVNSQALADSVEQLTAFVSHHCRPRDDVVNPATNVAYTAAELI